MASSSEPTSTSPRPDTVQCMRAPPRSSWLTFSPMAISTIRREPPQQEALPPPPITTPRGAPPPTPGRPPTAGPSPPPKDPRPGGGGGGGAPRAPLFGGLAADGGD